VCRYWFVVDFTGQLHGVTPTPASQAISFHAPNNASAMMIASARL
jgi:hypothetical protein